MPTGSQADFGFLSGLADTASQAILPYFRTSLEVDDKPGKAVFDPVTAADRAAETALREKIAQAFPDDGLIGEEFGEDRPGAAHVWVIDPIDGTRAFLAGMPTWGTLVGRLSGGRATLGMMAQPYLGEVFLGDGERSELRFGGGQRVLRTNPAPSLGHATLMTTSPRLFTPQESEGYERLAAAIRMERFGGDCYAYAMLAAGHVDLVVEAGLAIYDIAPLIAIIEGAGGVISTWDGGSAAAGGRVVAAADRRLHDAALTLLAG